MDWIQTLSVVVRAYWGPVLLITLGFALVWIALRLRSETIPDWVMNEARRSLYLERFDISAIRTLLTSSFSDADDLKRFCNDRSAFRPILVHVPGNASLADVTNSLVVFCQTQMSLDQLLTEVRRVNPNQYARYQNRLPTSEEVPEDLPSRFWRSVPRLWQLGKDGMMFTGAALPLIGLVWMVGISLNLSPSVSLISLRYMADGWDPRIVDLRTSTGQGVPVAAGQSLQFFDFWIAVPENAPQYKVKIEIFAGKERIGSTSPVELVADSTHPGAKKIAQVLIEEGYAHEKLDYAWHVQPSWKDLDVVLITERKGQVVGSTKAKIHLEPGGSSWLFDPPNLSFASIVYSVDDGTPRVLDLRDATTRGIAVQPGDSLALHDLWYVSNRDGATGDLVYASGFLSPDAEREITGTYTETQEYVIEQGIHSFSASELSWSSVPTNAKYLLLHLARNPTPSIFMDALVIPLRPAGSPGLIPYSKGTEVPAFLTSFRYMVDNFDPRTADLRTVATSGIPAISGHELRIFDIWVTVLADMPEHTVRVKAYANGERIGITSAKPAAAGLVGWEGSAAFTVEAFPDESNKGQWIVQPDWEDLEIVVASYDGDEMVASSTTVVALKPGSTAWLLSSPIPRFTSIVYTVNEGSPRVLDLRKAGDVGLEAQPGDILTLAGIWYHSLSGGGRVQAEAYLTAEGFDAATYQAADYNDVKVGTHELHITPLTWAIPEDKKYLILSLSREDKVVTDRLVVPLGAEESAALVPASEAVVWPFEQVEYVDFELPSDLDDWHGVPPSTVAQTSDRAFTGSRALAVSTAGTSEDDWIFTAWEHAFQAEVVVGQVYWPRAADKGPEWAQICAINTSACVFIPQKLDRWNTFVLDLSELNSGDEPLNTLELRGLAIQGEVYGTSEENPYSFYVDGVQLYPVQLP